MDYTWTLNELQDMQKAKINKTLISKIEPPEDKQSKLVKDSDLNGFAIRVWKSGTITYLVDVWDPVIKGHKKYTIGKHGAVTPEQARKAALGIISDLANGVDVGAKKKEIALGAKKTQAESVTLWQAWKKHKEAKNMTPKTVYVNEGEIKRCFNDWIDLPLLAIDTEAVIKKHKELSEHIGPRSNGNGAKATADRAMRILRALFNSHIDRNNLDIQNPVTKAFKIIDRNKPVRRQTLIKDHELAIWRQAVDGISNETTRDFLLLLLYTGLRKTEGMELKWEEIDLKSKTLTLPETRTKNKEIHSLPLSSELFKLLSNRYQNRNIASPYVFPGVDYKRAMADPKRMIQKVVDESGVKFSCHDLRRTFITVSERLAIPYRTQKKLINHKDKDVTSDYIVVNVEEMREPMQMITDHIVAQMMPEKSKVKVEA